MTATTVFGDRYEIVRPIARGGMAEVFLATDTRLHRPVAIKRMLDEFATNDAFQARFEREARAAAGLNQANMVQVYDYGIEADRPYIVMEYVRGKTLRELLHEQGVPPPERAAEVVADVAGALQFAHEHGIVHRDVKPGNIMIDAEGVVKVTDFGIAQDTSNHQDAELTQAGSVVGTAAYFSPEQAQGKTADARSDVYSMGCVLYELMTGHAPFDGESSWAIAYKHVNDPVSPPSKTVPMVPVALEAIAMKALNKNPEARYQSAWEMREDLKRYLQGEEPIAILAPLAGVAAGAALAGAAVAGTAAAAEHGAPATSTMLATPGTGEPAGEPVPEKRRRWPWVVAIIAILLALGAGIFFLASALTSSAEMIEVPDVAGKSLEDAETELQAAGFRTETKTELSSDVSAGNVIRTDPAAGDDAEKGSTIAIFVSAGGEPVPVPDVVGQSEQNARFILEEAGFVVQVTRQQSPQSEGTVIAQDPSADTEETPGESILLTVSSGPPTVTVPDVRGLKSDDAQGVLARAGFKVDTVRQESSRTEDTVITQVPSQGAQAPEGSTVTITVSAGETVEVPRVIGLSRADAEAQLTSVGFVVEAQQSVGCDAPDVVCGQAPTEGTQAKKGSTVSIQYGPPAPSPEPTPEPPAPPGDGAGE